MEKRPEAATESLRSVEESARQAVSELRSVLGSLRTPDEESTSATPSLSHLPALFADAAILGLEVDHVLVGEAGLIDVLTMSQSATLYRVVQEALANVRRHSTASTARVVLRLDETTAEVEVLDDGHPRSATHGTGMGQLGIRERVQALGGTAEIGPRSERGYRVRARLPITAGATT